MLKTGCASIVWAAMLCQLGAAQSDPGVQLANQVRADALALAGSRTWGAWRANHPREIVKEFDYETGGSPDSDESPSAHESGKCGDSTGELAGGVTRTASFYAPLVRQGKLPALPEQVDHSLTRRCELDELWYVARTPVRMDSVIGGLEAAWGKANGQSEVMDVWDAQQEPGVMAWHRDGWNAWVVPNAAGLGIFIRRNGMPDNSDPLSNTNGNRQVAKDSAAELVAIAALDASMSADMVKRSACAKQASADHDYAAAADRLAKWLRAARRLPPARRAAALILADDYMSCIDETLPDESRQPFIDLGARFDEGCAEDGGQYGHTFRKQAEKLDPDGKAGAWGQLADLWKYCAVEGGATFVGMAEKLMARLPAQGASLHYLIGRAHEVRLAFAYPGGFPDDGDSGVAQLSPAAKQRERLAAVRAYRNLIQENPNDAHAVFAWREAWRLLAGLKPPAVTFGCTCE